MEAAAWGSARWADSYLMPDEPASEGLRAAFGAKGGNGPHVVAVLLQVANTLLSQCVTLRLSWCCREATLDYAPTLPSHKCVSHHE